MREDYIFPEIFVEDTNIKSDKYILFESKKGNIKIVKECGEPSEEISCFAKIPYDNALETILDIYGNRIKKSFILKTKNNDLLLVKSSSHPKIIEVKGWIVRILVTEGEKIRKWQRVAYVLTKKYETRTIKSPWSGIVTYIGYVFGEKPEHYVIVVVDEDEVKYLGRIQ